MANRKPFRPFATLVAIAIVAAYYLFTGGGNTVEQEAPNEISQAYVNRQSEVMVEASGFVTRILPDDNEGSRHQRFIVGLADGQTVLVSHNIDLAPRIDDLRPGEPVTFRGQYEYNTKGGVVHWTHHDPRGNRPGGWIEYRGERYR